MNGTGHPGPIEAADGREAEVALERTLALAFAPLHKRAFGTAVGTVTGLVIFLLTAVHLLRDLGGRVNLGLLSQYLRGYEVSWTGALIGAAWGLFIGFIAGWFIAFTRNLVLAIWLLVVQARADLAATRDFLDHV